MARAETDTAQNRANEQRRKLWFIDKFTRIQFYVFSHYLTRKMVITEIGKKSFLLDERTMNDHREWEKRKERKKNAELYIEMIAQVAVLQQFKKKATEISICLQ
jgi:hypothetical protein